MSWVDRLNEAAYTSPSGVRVKFDYEDVRRSFDKKTSAFNFTDADGTYIQDNGVSGRRYPLRVYFWGADHDLTADIFDAALREKGVGKLDHPRYGNIDVVPYGTITQRDDLKTAANQTVFELEFWDTINLIYPQSQNDPASEVLSAILAYNLAGSEEFEDVTSLGTTAEQITIKAPYQGLLARIKSGLQTIADTQDSVKKQFNTIYDSINNAIDILIAEPLTLALQTIQLIQSPARALSNIQARLDAYNNLVDSIINDVNAISIPGLGSENSNNFHVKDLNVLTYISALVVAVVNNQFTTKTEALNAADTILTQFDNVVDWRDDNFISLFEIDQGNAYQKIQQAVALSAGFLVQISFSLKQERKIIIDRNRTIIDLAAELYGEGFEDQLDFLITSNDLTGDQILELKKGQTIVYYI